MRRFCADTGFFFALYDRSERRHAAAEEFFAEQVEKAGNVLVLPWPIMYESLNSRFVANIPQVAAVNRHLVSLRRTNQVELLDDRRYRDRALEDCFKETGRPLRSYRVLSLVDRVIRQILTDTKVHIDGLLTYDMAGFQDVCARTRKELISA